MSFPRVVSTSAIFVSVSMWSQLLESGLEVLSFFFSFYSLSLSLYEVASLSHSETFLCFLLKV